MFSSSPSHSALFWDTGKSENDGKRCKLSKPFESSTSWSLHPCYLGWAALNPGVQTQKLLKDIPMEPIFCFPSISYPFLSLISYQRQLYFAFLTQINFLLSSTSTARPATSINIQIVLSPALPDLQLHLFNPCNAATAVALDPWTDWEFAELFHILSKNIHISILIPKAVKWIKLEDKSTG